jgi:hypothetical protein
MQCAYFVGAGLLANEVSQSPSLFDETGIGRFVVLPIDTLAHSILTAAWQGL